jgi:hypothetical protein
MNYRDLYHLPLDSTAAGFMFCFCRCIAIKKASFMSHRTAWKINTTLSFQVAVPSSRPYFFS